MESGWWKFGEKKGNEDERWTKFIKNFTMTHGLSPSNNDSRKKWKWLAIPSIRSFIFEINYSIIRLFFTAAKYDYKKGTMNTAIRVVMKILPSKTKNWYKRQNQLKKFVKHLILSVEKK